MKGTFTKALALTLLIPSASIFACQPAAQVEGVAAPAAASANVAASAAAAASAEVTAPVAKEVVAGLQQTALDNIKATSDSVKSAAANTTAQGWGSSIKNAGSALWKGTTNVVMHPWKTTKNVGSWMNNNRWTTAAIAAVPAAYFGYRYFFPAVEDTDAGSFFASADAQAELEVNIKALNAMKKQVKDNAEAIKAGKKVAVENLVSVKFEILTKEDVRAGYLAKSGKSADGKKTSRKYETSKFKFDALKGLTAYANMHTNLNVLTKFAQHIKFFDGYTVQEKKDSVEKRAKTLEAFIDALNSRLAGKLAEVKNLAQEAEQAPAKEEKAKSAKKDNAKASKKAAAPKAPEAQVNDAAETSADEAEEATELGYTTRGLNFVQSNWKAGLGTLAALGVAGYVGSRYASK